MEIDPKDIGFSGDDYVAELMENEELMPSNDEAAPNIDPSNGHLETAEEKVAAPILKHYQLKWNRLRKHYSDEYLELFHRTYNTNAITQDSTDLLNSQHGAVSWTSDEKKILFAAIAKFGQHDLPRLAAAIGTKSPIEILVYIDAVRNALVNRQLFMAKAKNISVIDIPAAIEIQAECEAALEKAADALNAYQEQFDMAAGQIDGQALWLINREVASRIDTENDQAETDIVSESSEDESEDKGTRESQQPTRDNIRSSARKLFNFSTMLDLSEQFFMNSSTQSTRPHWEDVAETGQRPELTEDTAQMLFDLVASKLRQILQVAIEVTSARILSMSAGYIPTAKLSNTDVTTALDILNMPRNAREFWRGLARRDQLEVVSGSHSKGSARYDKLSYSRVEAALAAAVAVKENRGRSRSRSQGSESSSNIPVTTDSEGISGADGNDNYGDDKALDSGNNSISDADFRVSSIESPSSKEASSPSDSDVLNEPSSKPVLSHEERRLVLEEAAEEYAEKLDQRACIEEERKLWQVLGKRPSADITIDEARELALRPKTLRKTQEELRGWSCEYMADWERFGTLLLPEIDGTATEPHKKRKLDESKDGDPIVSTSKEQRLDILESDGDG